MDNNFSIIIPCYNRGDIISRAIDSVLNQSYTHYEIIVVDDGSNDNTKEIVENYGGVNYIFQENRGVSTARNLGMKYSTNPWLLFLDSDDELLVNTLLDFNEFLNLNTNCETVQGGYEIFQLGVGKKMFPIKDKSSFISGSFIIQKDCFKRIGGYDENLKFAENTELAFNLNSSGFRICKMEKIVFKYHQNVNGGSKNLSNIRTSLIHILEKYKGSLNNHIRYLYLQNLAVIELRFHNFKSGQRYLFQSWRLKPYKLLTFLRLVISFIPMLSKYIYHNPNQKT